MSFDAIVFFMLHNLAEVKQPDTFDAYSSGSSH